MDEGTAIPSSPCASAALTAPLMSQTRVADASERQAEEQVTTEGRGDVLHLTC